MDPDIFALMGSMADKVGIKPDEYALPPLTSSDANCLIPIKAIRREQLQPQD